MTSEKRLESFEKMLESVQQQYQDTAEKMSVLKNQGREKSATYRQLMGSKLQLGTMLSMYKAYGLLDEKSENT